MFLINRRKPYRYESLGSLLQWLQHANYYDTPRWIATFLPPGEAARPDLMRRPQRYQTLADVLRVRVEAVYALTLHRFVSVCSGPDSWSQASLECIYQDDGRALPLWEPGYQRMVFRPRNTPSICPQCWPEQPALLPPWPLHLVTSCPRHQVRLVDTCLCGGTLKMATPDWVCAWCGTPAPIIPAADDANHLLATLVWSAIGCSDEPFPPPSQNLPPDHPLQTMSATRFLQFLWSGIQRWERYRRHIAGTAVSQTLEDWHVQLVALARALLDWPNTWYEMVEQAVKREWMTLWYDQTVPAMLHRRFAHNAWEWLHETWLWFSEAHQTSQDQRVYYWVPTDSKQAQFAGFPHQPIAMTRQEVPEVFGVDTMGVQDLLHGARIRPPAVPINDERAAWPFVFAACVQWLQYEPEVSRGIQQIATRLGVAEHIVKSLVRAGALSSVPMLSLHGRLAWCMNPVHLDTLLQELLEIMETPAHGTDHQSSPDVLRLDEAMGLVQQAGISLAGLVSAMEHGSFEAFWNYDRLGLSILWLVWEAVQALVRRSRPSTETRWWTGQELCTHLSCQPIVLRRLNESGVLLPRNDSNGAVAHWPYAEVDVQEFLRQYEGDAHATALPVTTRLFYHQGYVWGGYQLALIPPASEHATGRALPDSERPDEADGTLIRLQ